MGEHATLEQLEELAERLGITVRHVTLKGEGSAHAGGLCRIHGQAVLIVNKKATAMEKRLLLVESLKRYDLSDVYLLPSLRELLDITSSSTGGI